jgi:hypothetical protein
MNSEKTKMKNERKEIKLKNSPHKLSVFQNPDTSGRGFCRQNYINKITEQ